MRGIRALILAGCVAAAASCSGGGGVTPTPNPQPQPQPQPQPTAPTVTAVAPAFGPFGGGTAITISGTNFVAGATVTIGGAAASGVNVTSATSLTATTAAVALPVAAVDIVVTNPTALAGTLAGGFQYRGVVARTTQAEYTGNVTRNIRVDGGPSFAVPGAVAFFRWNCGQTPPGANCQQSGQTPNLVYTRPGALNAPPITYNATLEVEDTLGNKATTTFQVRVSQIY